MKTALLRKATRHSNGTRSWAVPGFTNPAKLVPRGIRTVVGELGQFRFPKLDPQGDEMQFGMCLDRHRALARQEARRLVAAAKPKRATLIVDARAVPAGSVWCIGQHTKAERAALERDARKGAMVKVRAFWANGLGPLKMVFIPVRHEAR